MENACKTHFNKHPKRYYIGYNVLIYTAYLYIRHNMSLYEIICCIPTQILTKKPLPENMKRNNEKHRGHYNQSQRGQLNLLINLLN